MIDDLTTCVLPACSRTGILAFLINASLVQGTFGANDTFRPTTWWCPNETCLTRANRVSVDFAAYAIGSARRRRTRIDWFVLLRFVASGQWIPSKARNTSATGRVIDHVTFGIDSAHPWAWVFAFVIDAGLVTWAIAIGHTFRTASTVRIAEVFRQTYTRASTITFLTNCI